MHELWLIPLGRRGLWDYQSAAIPDKLMYPDYGDLKSPCNVLRAFAALVTIDDRLVTSRQSNIRRPGIIRYCCVVVSAANTAPVPNPYEPRFWP